MVLRERGGLTKKYPTIEITKGDSTDKIFYMGYTGYCINEPRREKTGFLHMQKQRRKADQRLCFRFTDSTIHLHPKFEISSVQPSAVWLCRTRSETRMLVFS